MKKSSLAVIVTLLIIKSALGDNSSDSPASTRQAYVELATWLAFGFSDSPAFSTSPKSTRSQLLSSISQDTVDGKRLFLELNSTTNMDPALMSIVSDSEKAMTQLFDDCDAFERIPNSSVTDNILMLFHGSTLNINGDAQDLQKASDHDTTVRLLQTSVIQAMRHLDQARQMLPVIAKKLSGPISDIPIIINIHEAFGLNVPDQLNLINASEMTLHDCTMVVTLRGKYGETRQNIHFAKTWSPQQTLFANYDAGIQILDQRPCRTTVDYIEEVEIQLYCDELASKPIVYKYDNAEMDKDVGLSLDKYFNPNSSYRPFAKGIIFDDHRAVGFAFTGLQYLPKGTITVTAKKGDVTVTQKLDFSLWRAGETKWIELNSNLMLNENWNPVEWDAKFQFDHTTVTRSYHWTR